MSTKRKAPGKLAAPVVSRSARNPYKSTIDESKTSVSRPDAALPASSAPETIEISSDPGSDDEDISDVEDEKYTVAAASLVNGQKKSQPQINGTVKTDGGAAETSDDNGGGEEEEEGTSPSFGELLRGNDAIDVAALLQQQQNNSSLTSGRGASVAGGRRLRPAALAAQLPTHQSLTTVLTQALRTDDVDMLELCLDTPDSAVVRNTVEGIDSALAGTLLTKLAARLYRKPGRAGSLMLWVQWTLIAHGGALASQPKIVQGLGGLQKVLAERSRGLNSLLALKGKLDLLEGQMNMRRSTQRRRHRGGAGGRRGIDEDEDEDGDEEDEDVIYVEGEADNSSDKALSNGHLRSRRSAADDDDDDAEARLLNGAIADSSDEDDDSDAEDDDGDDDNDAQESLDEDDVDHDDVDDGGDESMGEDEESDVDAAPPSKVQKVGKSFSKRK